MKIFAVIRNYDAAAARVSENAPDSASTAPLPLFGSGAPSWYEIPDSALLRSGNPFFIPDFDTQFRALPSIAFRVGRLGKCIAPRFASRYLQEFAAGAAIVASSRLAQAREAGEPWCDATAFDRCCWLGNLQPFCTLSQYDTIRFSCGDNSINYRPAELTISAEECVEMLSRNNTLKMGDIILAALHPVGFDLEIGQRFTAGPDNENVNFIDIKIR